VRKPLIFLTCLVIFSILPAGCSSTPPAIITTQTTSPPTITTHTTLTSMPTGLTTSIPAKPPGSTTTGQTVTILPPAVTGLIAHNAYDGKVNLWWDPAKKIDFGHYNIYVNKTDIVDVTGMKPVQQINDIVGCNCQLNGLENGTKYYFAVSVVGETGIENKKVTCVSVMPVAMSRGSKDPVLVVDVYKSDKAWAGTTLLPDNHDISNPRIIEVNMEGEIIWKYDLPATLKKYTNPGFDVELLANNNILFVLPGNGVYEIDRTGKTVWSYIDAKVSHDADRLPNGNTLVVYGNNDQKGDAQVKEINPAGTIVWSWYARDHFNKEPYSSIYEEGWTHTNAVSRLENGNTLISPRNFNMLVEVAPDGEVVETYGEGLFIQQHDPVILPNGDILLCNHGKPHRVIEYDPETGKIVWQTKAFELNEIPVRDANRLPNGNTLITCSTKIIEITPGGEIVWEIILKDITLTGMDAASRGFYKAERIGL
jgi:hypothetical protein